jgi:hypothetical protein
MLPAGGSSGFHPTGNAASGALRFAPIRWRPFVVGAGKPI